MIEMNKIYNESNLETMARIQDNSIDLVMTSPPYAEARKSTYGGVCADDYVEWFKPIAKEIYRILKPTGSFILNIGDNTIDGETHLYTFELPIVLKRELGFKFIDPLVWHKKNPAPGKFKNRFKDGWEFCYHFSKTLDLKFNPYAVATQTKQESLARALRQKDDANAKSLTGSGFTTAAGTIKKNIEKRRERNNNSGVGTIDENFEDLEMALPSNVLHLSGETTNVGHPAPYPTEIPAFFIKAFTDENDIVYDPFFGSGTTGEVCLRTNRKFIGSELKQDYIDIANKRLNPFILTLFS
jgi:site-specific DNA-methyltransferase (adenine-specific)/site-specific DNA-methyltransferase (cytosine-N4-specific)